MDCTFTDLSYRDTGHFSAILNAYIDNDERLSPFFSHPVNVEGIAASIRSRTQFPVNRTLLVEELLQQYEDLPHANNVGNNIQLLLNENTFTVCTAHQPAIFTGNLFFIYKIIHAIKLAKRLQEQFPENRFVPVYYMGSEDADLDELGNISMGGEKILWETKQKGAIGRMNTKGLEKIISRIEGELLVHPFGAELVALLRDCYQHSRDVQTATIKLIHRLFSDYGLVVLIPDNARFKRQLAPVFEDELLNQTSTRIVSKTVERISSSFPVQAQPRDINLFYLKDDIRERIERKGGEWRVVETNISFNKTTLLTELQEHPERFSPNVILRGILQETILPNVAFIGGGGELAYWMELQTLFEHYKVPYPVLIVRNSFVVIEKKWMAKMDRLGITIPSVFHAEQSLLNDLVHRDSDKQLTLKKEIEDIRKYYCKVKEIAEKVDVTLGAHVEALRARSIKPIEVLEKKMLRAEKRKFTEQSRQLAAIKKALFPNNGLQERVDNFMPFYSKWGMDFIRMLYDHSFTTEQKFGVLVAGD